MTQEEKDLLLKDLCARLPYGVKCACPNNFNGEFDITSPLSTSHIDMIISGTHPIKPYLRPMSSMTEEELNEYDKATDLDVADSSETLRANLKAKSRVSVSKWYHGNDWLNKNMFDYRGLIPMGLALEAPEGMYKN